MAPAIGQGFDKKDLQDVDVPVQIVDGDADIVNPLAVNAKHYTENIATARPLIILPGERGHYIKPSTPQVSAAELQEVAKLAADFFKSRYTIDLYTGLRDKATRLYHHSNNC